MKKEKYIIVIEDVSLMVGDFTNSVNSKIEDGYTPCGGLAILEDQISNRIYFYQAMILKGETK